MRDELGQLEGRAYKQVQLLSFRLFAEATEDRAKVEWTIRAPRGGKVGLTARHERVGVVRAEVELVEDHP